MAAEQAKELSTAKQVVVIPNIPDIHRRDPRKHKSQHYRKCDYQFRHERITLELAQFLDY